MKHKARKRFGQNFLKNEQVIDQIVQAIQPNPKDNMVEIGPGLGAITQPLMALLNHLTVVELDRDLLQHLQSLPKAKDKLTLINGDALTVDFSQLGASLRVVGNLPYNISTPLILHLLKYVQHIQDLHVMLQKEVADRIAASPGSKTYGRLSVMVQYHCEVTDLFQVPPSAFHPQPKVDSTVIRLTPHPQNPYEKINPDQLKAITTKAFHMRRKTLANNLKGVMSPDELQTIGIDPKQRPEQLSVNDYVQIAKFVNK